MHRAFTSSGCPIRCGSRTSSPPPLPKTSRGAATASNDGRGSARGKASPLTPARAGGRGAPPPRVDKARPLGIDAMQRVLSSYVFSNRKLTPVLLAEVQGAGIGAVELF